MKALWHKLHHQLVEPLLSVLFPPVCLHCLVPLLSHTDLPLCSTCHSGLTPIEPQWVDQNVFQRIETPYLDGLVVALGFTPAVQSLIHHLKYRMMARVGIQLGQFIAPLVAPRLPLAARPLLVPVPLHRRRVRERGYNQSERIARGLAQQWHLPVAPHLLERTRHTRSQTNLNRAERQENVREAFRARRIATTFNTVLLIDDVVTTGATMNACAAALKASGIQRVIGVAVATPREAFLDTPTGQLAAQSTD